MKKKGNISYLRIFATLTVICLHVACTLVYNNYPMNTHQKYFFDIATYFFQFGVPLFLMISGTLLLRKDKIITPSLCVKKYCSRFALALIIFGIPFAFLVLYFNDRSLSNYYFGELTLMVLNNAGLSHMWYLLMIIGIYLILPFIKVFTDYCNEKVLEYILIVLIFMDSIIPLINNVFHQDISLYPQIGIYLFYLLLGFYLSNKEFSKNINKISFFTIGIIIFILVVIELTGGPIDELTDISSPLTIILSTMIYTFFHSKNLDCSESLWKLDRLCFGVYLVHPVFIQFFYRYLHVTPICDTYSLAFVLFCIMITVMSFFISWIMSLIKPLKKYVL